MKAVKAEEGHAQQLDGRLARKLQEEEDAAQCARRRAKEDNEAASLALARQLAEEDAGAAAASTSDSVEDAPVCLFCLEASPDLMARDCCATLVCVCGGCLRRWISVDCVGNGRDPTCPGGCGKEVSSAERRHLFENFMQDFEKLEQQMLERAVAKDKDMHRCKTPDCLGKVHWAPERGERRARRWECRECYFTSCLTCGLRPFHDGKTCEEARVAAEKAAAEAASAGEQRAVEEAKTAKYLEQKTKKCGGCGTALQKSSGCNKFQCPCGHRMCWKCGKSADGVTGRLPCDCTGAEHSFLNPLTHVPYKPEEPQPKRQRR